MSSVSLKNFYQGCIAHLNEIYVMQFQLLENKLNYEFCKDLSFMIK